ncbi:hypothetical protein [Cryptosporangium aurantiacum]|uniref:Uncharacterized protein n=1 Tax=Cryptosporangium aurantiacum TaxID=134849 RepID=A0A1M7MW63_9ACTN|nr:hypothetical protein [Cryptosporangium aurantiacum]SHM95415.1 hypothetical protein SAMN05443668_102302 [Cryptosporangium aurantiacum]
MTPRSFPPSLDTEADQTDVAEQARTLVDEDDDTATPPPVQGLEVPVADAIEQSRAVPIDEDDYR